MRVSWQGIGRDSESDGELLAITIREEYDLLVDIRGVRAFVSRLEVLTEERKISGEAGFEWTAQFTEIQSLLHQLQETRFKQVLSGISLSTGWNELPTTDFPTLLEELKTFFASKITVAVVGTAPNYSVEYRFGTFVLLRAINVADLQKLQAAVAVLISRPSDDVDQAILDISNGNLTPIAGLNKLADGIDLKGGPLGGIAVALSILAARLSGPPVIANAAGTAIGAVAGSKVFKDVAEGLGIILKNAAESYEIFQRAELLRQERKRKEYELERDKQRDIERFQIKETGIVLAGDGPAIGRGHDTRDTC